MCVVFLCCFLFSSAAVWVPDHLLCCIPLGSAVCSHEQHHGDPRGRQQVHHTAPSTHRWTSSYHWSVAKLAPRKEGILDQKTQNATFQRCSSKIACISVCFPLLMLFFLKVRVVTFLFCSKQACVAVVQESQIQRKAAVGRSAQWCSLYCQSNQHGNCCKGRTGKTSEGQGGTYMGFSRCIDAVLNWTVQLTVQLLVDLLADMSVTGGLYSWQFSYWWTGQLTGQLLVDCTADMSVTGGLVSWQFSYWWTVQLTCQLLVDWSADGSVTGGLFSRQFSYWWTSHWIVGSVSHCFSLWGYLCGPFGVHGCNETAVSDLLRCAVWYAWLQWNSCQWLATLCGMHGWMKQLSVTCYDVWYAWL